ncbi:MAG TPA: GAF domain-containing protein [Terriglobales bacterium]|nr:GAF domain-containing protein [Terriglobales bacterium]
MDSPNARHVSFLQLRDAVLCVECELISYNSTTQCLACGSKAVLSLACALGGSLRGQQTANLIEDEVLQRVVAEVLRPPSAARCGPAGEGAAWTTRPGNLVDFPGRAAFDAGSDDRDAPMIDIASVQLDQRAQSCALARPHSVLPRILERAWSLTHAAGAALALWQNGRMICQTRIGNGAPELGTEIQTHRGLSGLCLRTGQAWRCDHAEKDPQVDRQSCRELGVSSLVVAPLTHLNGGVLGVLEVVSAEPYAFDDRDVATVQMLASLMVMALTQKPGSESQPEVARGLRPRSERLVEPARALVM